MNKSALAVAASIFHSSLRLCACVLALTKVRPRVPHPGHTRVAVRLTRIHESGRLTGISVGAASKHACRHRRGCGRCARVCARSTRR